VQGSGHSSQLAGSIYDQIIMKAPEANAEEADLELREIMLAMGWVLPHHQSTLPLPGLSAHSTVSSDLFF